MDFRSSEDWLKVTVFVRKFGHFLALAIQIGYVFGYGRTPLDTQDELFALRALVAEQAAKLSAQQVKVTKRDTIIGLLRAQLEMLRHRQYGASSEKTVRKIEQI